MMNNKIAEHWDTSNPFIGSIDLEYLYKKASESPRNSYRYNIHPDSEDHLQQMIICLLKSDSILIHKHSDRAEVLHILKGEGTLCFYDESINITHTKKLVPFEQGGDFCVRIPINQWHSLVPLSDSIYIHEVSNGPYRPENTIRYSN